MQAETVAPAVEVIRHQALAAQALRAAMVATDQALGLVVAVAAEMEMGPQLARVVQVAQENYQPSHLLITLAAVQAETQMLLNLGALEAVAILALR
jgi:hypothetical protein